jgi:acyl-coenzyme A synthetase/AMP-(fatty) acid ligase
LFFGYATGTNLMFPFAVGATTCLFSERPTAETLAAAVAMYRPTVVTNVPTMMSKLLDHDDALRTVHPLWVGSGRVLLKDRYSGSKGRRRM